MLLHLLALLADPALAEVITSTLSVSTSRGPLKGFHVDYGSDPSQLYHGSADIFLGLPFVQPPIGPLRFAKPVPVCNYTSDGGVYDATYYRAACPQNQVCGSQGQSEDCLHVNVLTPNATSDVKYPVIVAIHGGALMLGCASQYAYPGVITNLVSRGVVVVVIQYRIGLLGFFTDGTEGFPANLGMLDQVEALRWVQDQIGYFGGDKNRVTLVGQSAGSSSASAHTYSPLSQDLFHQAILQSGSILLMFDGAFGAGGTCETRALEAIVCQIPPSLFNSGNATEELKKCLESKNPEDWLKWDRTETWGWRIRVDGYFIPDVPHRLAPFRRDIPVIYGMMHDEWSFFDMLALAAGEVTVEHYTRTFFSHEWDYLASTMHPYINETKRIMEDVYAGVDVEDDDNDLWLRTTSAAFTSLVFSSFIQRDYQDYLAGGHADVWLYLMTYPKTINRPYDIPGFPDAVPHAAELSYIWRDEGFETAVENGDVTDEDYALSEWFGRTWASFAIHGVPDASWPRVPSTGTEIYLDIDGPNPKVNDETGFMVRDNVVQNQVFVAITGDFHPPQMDGKPSLTQDQFDAIKSSLANEECTVIIDDSSIPSIAPAATTVSPSTVTVATATTDALISTTPNASLGRSTSIVFAMLAVLYSALLL